MAMFFKIWLNEEQLLWRDFNQRPPDKRTGALPTELHSPILVVFVYLLAQSFDWAVKKNGQ